MKTARLCSHIGQRGKINGNTTNHKGETEINENRIGKIKKTINNEKQSSSTNVDTS